MEKKEVIVYTQPDCPPCEITKAYLNDQEIPFQEIDVTKNTAARQKMINEFQSYSTPTVTVNGEIIRGFNLEKLDELLKEQ
ncbi:glutaredoxin family protein [Bacillus timonensis]|nr:glutaredoxin family protein [Bacillus timonensis]